MAVDGNRGRPSLNWHRDYAEQLLEGIPVNELTGRHSPATALAHAILALVDKLEDIPVLRVTLDEEDEELDP
jgi:hypothetical protein